MESSDGAPSQGPSLLFPSAASMMENNKLNSPLQSGLVLFPSAASVMENSKVNAPSQGGSMLFPSAASMMEDNKDSSPSLSGLMKFPSAPSFVMDPQESLKNVVNSVQDDTSSTSSQDDNESESSYEEVTIVRKEKKKKRKRRHDSSSNSASSETENQISGHNNQKKKKKKHKSSSSKKEKKEKRKKSKQRKSAKIKKIIKPDTIWLEDTTLEIEDAFRKDRRPDQKNYEYGSLYKMDVAKFYNPKWACLGLGYCISPKRKHSKKMKGAISSSRERYFSSIMKNIKVISDDNDVADDNNSFSQFVHTVESDVFIPITSNRPTKDNDGGPEDVNKKISERQKEFSRQLLERPHDVPLWIEFIEEQDERVPWSNELRDDQNWITSQALLEKKISIVEKALSSNPASSELILKHMDLVKRVWAPDRMAERWRKLVFQFPNRSVFWAEYLCHVQSDILVKMTVTQTLDLYRKAFRMLIGIHRGIVKSHKRELNSMDGILLLLNQMILFLWQAGCTEKVTSIVHCFVQYNLTRTPSVHNDEEKKKLFGQYFQQDGARFGEDKYISWSHYMNTTTTTKNTETKFEPSSSSSSSVSPTSISPIEYIPNISSSSDVKDEHQTFKECLKQAKQEYAAKIDDDDVKKKYWIRLESARAREEFLSYHGDVDACEDTDRVVLFDDLSFIMFSLESQEGVFQIVLSYLLLLGLPIPKTRYSKSLLKLSTKFTKVIEAVSQPCFCHSVDFCCDFVQIADSTLFSSSSSQCNRVPLMRRILRHTMEMFKDDSILQWLSATWFHSESTLFRRSFEDVKSEFDKKYWKEMRKFLKSLLKLPSNRSCAFLWNMYATYEWGIGNSGDAEKIFASALQLSLSQQTVKFSCASTLRFAIDLFLTIDRKDGDAINERARILNLFCKVYGPQTQGLTSLNLDVASPSLNSLTLFKVSKTLNEKFEELTVSLKTADQQEWNSHKNDFLCNYVVFVFFYADFAVFADTFERLLEMHEITLKQFQNLDYPDSLAYGMLLMDNHSKTNIGYFRTYVNYCERCFRAYPTDRRLFGFYSRAKRCGVDSLNVRKLFASCTKKCEDVRPWLHYLEYEKQRLLVSNALASNQSSNFEIVESQTSTQHRIHSIYQKMLKNKRFTHCPPLWIEFIEFLLQHRNEKSARNTFYTALRNCPASKELYMYGMEKLKGTFQENYDLMMEKEIRVKLIVEELDLLIED